ncbi:MAG: hypothetical protein K8L99_26215 [Anaerolineae bacterium]|nr:hypothetical protein [Anaerolineae bacterium]
MTRSIDRRRRNMMSGALTYTKIQAVTAWDIWYRLKETEGTDVQNYGTSGDALDAAITGTGLIIGEDGFLGTDEAYDFDGTGDGRVVIPESTVWQNTTSDTVMMLLKPRSAGTANAGRMFAPSGVNAFEALWNGSLGQINCFRKCSTSNANTITNVGVTADAYALIFVTFDETDKKIRVFKTQDGTVAECTYGTQTAGVGTVSNRLGNLYVGNGGAANRQQNALIDEFAFKSGILTLAQMQRIAHTLPFERAVIHVNAASGNDSNSGLAAASAKATVNAAKTALDTYFGSVGTIQVTAPVESPVTLDNLTFNGGDFLIKGNGAAWYAEGLHYTYSSGWSDAGGGIYTRSDQPTTSILFIETLNDSDGFYTALTANTSTPTTPAAGQFGVDSGTLYIHLPGDVDPNSHTIIQPRSSTMLRPSGTTKLEVADAVLRYSRVDGVFVDDTASLKMRDCTVEYHGQDGISNSSADAETIQHEFIRVIARRAVSNDGFNIKVKGIATLIDCEGAYCGDEGCSPHDNSQIIVMGGRYHHNGTGGGITGVDNAVMILSGVRCDHNHRTVLPAGEAAISYLGNTSGSCDDCTVDNNTGPGFICDTTGDVTVSNLTSEDNTQSDILCA